MNSANIDYHQWFSYFLCFVLWFIYNKKCKLLHVSQGHLYTICILLLYLHTKSHTKILILHYTISAYIHNNISHLKHFSSLRRTPRSISSKPHTLPQWHPRKTQITNLIILIWLSYLPATNQTHFINPINKAPHTYNHHTISQSTHPHNTKYTHNQTNLTLPPHYSPQFTPILHHLNHIKHFPAYTLINHTYNNTSITHLYNHHKQKPQRPSIHEINHNKDSTCTYNYNTQHTTHNNITSKPHNHQIIHSQPHRLNHQYINNSPIHLVDNKHAQVSSNYTYRIYYQTQNSYLSFISNNTYLKPHFNLTHNHKFKYLFNPHLKYQPPSKNITASAYRPRHTYHNTYNLTNNWNLP